MTREEITNSQDYKATKAALKWWYSLPEEQRKVTDIDAEPDIVDAYSDGILYGWNNPNWISVEDELPKEQDWYLCYNDVEDGSEVLHWEGDGNVWMDNDWHYKSKEITHWMPLPQPPRKEDKK